MKKYIRRIAFFTRPLLNLRNRMQASKSWVVILGGRSYAREITQQLNVMGYRVYLLDAAPDAMNWRFAAASKKMNIYDPQNIPEIVELARKLGSPIVGMQSDDNLLPIYAEINRQLNNGTRFSGTAIQASFDKEAMRGCFEKAGMEIPVWKIIYNDDALEGLPLPALIKPRVGQGSKGVAYVETLEEARTAKAFIKDEMDQDSCLYEEYLDGRQFNIEGVVQNGTVYFHMITEECFTDFIPRFPACWYLFGPELDADIEKEILRETRDSLAACDFHSGAFHLELKFKENRAYTFDMSNRMPADFPRYTRQVMGIPAIADYMAAMCNQPLEQRPLKALPGQQRLRYYNYPDRSYHDQIRKISQDYAAKGKLDLFEDGFLLEMTGAEVILREFLEKTYALRHHD
jgi:biotin carboxylase